MVEPTLYRTHGSGMNDVIEPKLCTRTHGFGMMNDVVGEQGTLEQRYGCSRRVKQDYDSSQSGASKS